jgi:putative aldouronate transport system permease protein
MGPNTLNVKTKQTSNKVPSKLQRILKHIKKDRQLLVIFMPCLLFYIIFRYGPMYGLIISFKKYSVFQGILKSPWVGIKYFEQFFTSPDFWLLTKNTFLLGAYSLLWTFPFPIIFALMLNELRSQKFKKLVQTVTYLPTFLSIVIISSMVTDFLSPGHGIINTIIASLGFEKIYFMIKPEWFRTVYIASDIWANIGFGAIIYLAALAGVDPTLYEAGKMDGCSRFHAMWYITLPSIMPTIATMFILKAGNMFRIGYEKILLLYNPTIYETADVFSTFVYRKGLLESNYSYAAAVGLFESVIALVMIVLANKISKKLSENSLW